MTIRHQFRVRRHTGYGRSREGWQVPAASQEGRLRCGTEAESEGVLDEIVGHVVLFILIPIFEAR